ncbi:MAG: PDZ domain-containing protein [Polyangiaceae bacterium]
MVTKEALFALAKALEGVPVLGTLSGSPAARAGIRYGDVLLSVNGRRTRTVLDFIEAKALRTDGMDIVVFRTGTEKIESLTYDEPSERMDPASILAEIVAMRIAPDEFEGEGPRGSVKPPA